MKDLILKIAEMSRFEVLGYLIIIPLVVLITALVVYGLIKAIDHYAEEGRKLEAKSFSFIATSTVITLYLFVTIWLAMLETKDLLQSFFQ